MCQSKVFIPSHLLPSIPPFHPPHHLPRAGERKSFHACIVCVVVLHCGVVLPGLVQGLVFPRHSHLRANPCPPPLFLPDKVLTYKFMRHFNLFGIEDDNHMDDSLMQVPPIPLTFPLCAVFPPFCTPFLPTFPFPEPVRYGHQSPVQQPPGPAPQEPLEAEHV